ncbi:MAG TPA: hypothetical protein VJ890_29695 [Vineibacter sp.]|nr:hypothetical protein [Vineibacter sp.]
MPKIFGPDIKLFSVPDKKADGTQWTAFDSAADVGIVQDALNILRNTVAKIPTCDQYFVSLPRRRSFVDVLNDDNVWICYDPTGPDAGETVGRYITIGKKTLKAGRWQVAATLVHELAHVGGAEDTNAQAETALIHCGLKAHFVPSNTSTPASSPGNRPRR